MKDHNKRLIEILEVLKKEKLTKGVTPEKFRRVVERLGPTFIKFGQIMSMRNDILPMEYCNELKKLQSNVEPMDYSVIKEIIEESYKVPLYEVFKEFEKEPIGSASIAQVHKAVLKDGRVVVAKIQRKNIYEIMSRDVTLLKRALKMLKLTGITGDVLDFDMLLNEMWETAKQEMNFLIEADHIKEFTELNKGIVYVACPKVIWEYTNSKVLVMDYVEGIQIDKIEKIKEAGYNLHDIAQKLAHNYVKQILGDAFFHADPHPGNIWIKDGKIVWLDLGMMGRLSLNDQKLLKQAALSFIQKDIIGVKNVILSIGKRTGPINHSKLYEDIEFFVNRYGNMSMEEMNIGSMMEELLGVAKDNNISMPQGVSMLSRGVLTIQGVIKTLSPKTNFLEIIKDYVSSNVLNDINFKKELIELCKKSMYSSKKIADIPSELSDLINMTIKGETKMNLELMESEDVLLSVNRMVNKVIISMITVGLLVGSSLLCTTHMQPQVLGIPLLGFIGFLTAFVLGVVLIIDIKRNN